MSPLKFVANQLIPLHFRCFSRTLILAVALSATPAWAAGGPPMFTDDPGTPGDGHWEINVATLSSHTTRTTTYQLPLIDANYGIGDRAQFKFEMPWLNQTDANKVSLNGAGDGLTGIKWRFYDVGEEAWQISTYPQIEFGFPLSNSTHDDLVESGTSYLLPFEFEHRHEEFDVNFELGRWFRPSQRGDSWIAGVALTHEVRKGFELIAELHDESALNKPQDELILNFGTRWDISKQYTLLLSAGRDLHNTLCITNTSLAYLGLQIRY